MLAKSDSDVGSLPESSPTRSSPRRPGPMYYVQSPSRDSSSHDGEKTTNSFHSTPVISPTGSPPHSHSNSSLGRGSRDSSSTRFSRSTKTGGKGSGRMDGKKGRGHGVGKKGRRRKEDEFDAIWEEDDELLLEQEGEGRPGFSKRSWYLIGFVFAFFVLFTFFSLVLWGVSKNQKPVISVKSLKFSVFEVHSGMDFSGVATAMASTNATMRLAYRNRGTFFGVHVTSTPLQLFYEQILIATGTMDKFYERRKSRRGITVNLNGTSVPLYGGNSNLNTKDGEITTPVPLTLNFKVRSRAYVLGRLVKPKFYKSISCSVVMDPKKMSKPISLRNSCTYQ